MKTQTLTLLVLLVAGSAFAGRCEVLKEGCPEEPTKLYRALGLAVWGTKMGDAVSTEMVLGVEGGVERNPFLQHRGVRISAAVAAPIIVNWGSDELRKRGHPKIALWLRIGAVAYWGYLTAHNLRQIE